jgi:hypothetical protein
MAEEQSSLDEFSLEVPHVEKTKGLDPRTEFDRLVGEQEEKKATGDIKKKRMIRNIRRLLKNNKNISLDKKNKEHDLLMEKSMEELEELMEDLKDQMYDDSGFPVSNSIITLTGPFLEKTFELDGFTQDLRMNAKLQMRLEDGLETYFPTRIKFIYEYLSLFVEFFGSLYDAKERFKKRKREEEEEHERKKQRTYKEPEPEVDSKSPDQ